MKSAVPVLLAIVSFFLSALYEQNKILFGTVLIKLQNETRRATTAVLTSQSYMNWTCHRRINKTCMICTGFHDRKVFPLGKCFQTTRNFFFLHAVAKQVTIPSELQSPAHNGTHYYFLFCERNYPRA